MKKLLFVLAVISLVGCGALNKSSDDSGGSPAVDEETGEELPVEDAGVLPHALYVASADQLPGCDADYEKVLVYVVAEEAFKSCSGGTWKIVDVGGADGADGAGALVRVDDEAAGANCAGGGKAVKTGIDDNGNKTLEDGEVDATNYVCDGVDTSSGAFEIVESYMAIGDGTNICDEYDPDESCWLNVAQVDVFGNGAWQVRIVFNHFYLDGSGEMDTSDKDLAFIISNGETSGVIKLIDRFVFRNDGTGGYLWAFLPSDKQKFYLIHDTNNNFSADGTDLLVGEYDLVKQ